MSQPQDSLGPEEYLPLGDQAFEDDTEDLVAVPVRRRRIPVPTLVLGAAAIAAFSFFGGVMAEKGSAPSSTSSSSSAASGSPTGAGRRLFGSPGAGRGATIGQVAAVEGSTLLVTTLSGNTVKVSTTQDTKITKAQQVPISSIDPGDTVVVRGAQGSDGTYVATQVSDSGAAASSGGLTSQLGFGGGGFGGAGPRSG
jgi:hypothetical protein